MKRLFLLFALVTSGPVFALDLVPQPVSCELHKEAMPMITYPCIEFIHNELAPLAHYLHARLPGGKAELAMDNSLALPAEGYRLETGAGGAKIVGKDYGGVWNGIQTFLQLLPDENRTYLSLQSVDIEDFPRFDYRGAMLDVARTFTPKKGVMRLVDNLARHKINKFHFHLSDDEGWRVEIKSVPELAGATADSGIGVTPSEGYFTQNEIREIVAFAALRNVEIIPEIDLPGHSLAAATACPQILCEDTPITKPKGYDWRNVWCAAREGNYAILDSIIREVSALFPSEIIHLGGDEVMTRQWRNCPRCQALMRAQKLSRPADLQDIFMSRLTEIAAKYGKKLGVWNEAAASGRLSKNATVWGWENVAEARKAARKGYPTVVCASNYFYFDMRQSPGEPGQKWAGIVTLEKVYSFDFKGFTKAEINNVRGVEATFFTEKLGQNGPEFLDYQFFPRACALAEIAWTPAEQRSWPDFECRMNDTHLARLAAMGIKYRKSL